MPRWLLSVLASIAVLLIVPAAQGQNTNLVQGGTFATSADFNRWNLGGAGYVWSSMDAGGSPSSGSVKFISNGNGSSYLGQTVPLASGGSYSFGGKAVNGSVAVAVSDGTHTWQTNASVDGVVGWQTLSGTFTAPATGQAVGVTLYVSGSITGANTSGADYADDIYLIGPPPPPQIDTFSATPSTVTPPQSATLSWSTESATSVTIDNGVGTEPVNGSVSVAPSVTTIYTLTATGAGGTATKQVTVTVTPAPTITFSANPMSIALGQSSTLTWTTTNATTFTIDNGLGARPTSGSVSVTPQTTTTYTLTATGSGGTRTATATVTVTPPPAITFSASPTTIAPGQTSTLTWTTTNATSVSIDNGIGGQALSGSFPVSPTATTTYTLTATGNGGTRTATATVTVSAPGTPQITFRPTPSVIASGGTATLTWTTSNATSVTLDHGIGAKPLNGSLPVSPAATTTYLLTATGTGGTKTATATVTIAPAPTIFFTATPTAVLPGGSVKLEWQVFDATTVVLDPGFGLQPLTGSMTVTPKTATMSLLTATGAGGTRVAQATVTIGGKRRAVRH